MIAMHSKEHRDLLIRAAVALETHTDLTAADVVALIRDLRAAAEPLKAGRIRIRCTDTLKNVSYVQVDTGKRTVSCMLSNGIPAGLGYAGVLGDRVAAEFDLSDATTPSDALAIMRRHGSYEYELV